MDSPRNGQASDNGNGQHSTGNAASNGLAEGNGVGASAGAVRGTSDRARDLPARMPGWAHDGIWGSYGARSTAPQVADTLDVAAALAAVRRGWRTVLAGVGVGAVAAGALVAFFPPRYKAHATVVVRNANDPAGSLLSRFGLAGDLGSGGGALGNVLKSPLETELQLLSSRDVLGQVVDSLGLQARVMAPFGVPSPTLIAPVPRDASFRQRTYTFTRSGANAFRVDGPDTALTAVVGRTVRLPAVGPVTVVAGSGGPDRFRVQFEDREDAITRLEDRLDVKKEGGELVSLDYAGPDSLTAAAVPNAVADVYLERRRTVDRGLNQRRYEFLSAQADTVARQLAESEDALRAQQDVSGVFDPESAGKAGVEALREARAERTTVEAERRAIRELVGQVERGFLNARQLAAFPSFLRSPAINSILSQVSTLETQRTELLDRRTERDPDVVVLTRSIRDLEQQLLPLGRTYAQSLDAQADELGRAQNQVESRLAHLPGQAEGAIRRQRDVRRLSQTLLGLQAQMIDARLAALSEGGQVRQVDLARAPKKRQFPQPVPTLLAGLALGALAGALWAAVRTLGSKRVRSAADAEASTGVPAAEFVPSRALLLGELAQVGTVVVVPVGVSGGAGPVAALLASQAGERGRRVAVLDLSDPARAAPVAADLRALAEAESAHDLTVVSAEGLDARRTAALLDPPRAVVLVAQAGRTTRAALDEAVAVASRFAVPVAGVVVAGAAR